MAGGHHSEPPPGFIEEINFQEMNINEVIVNSFRLFIISLFDIFELSDDRKRGVWRRL